MLVKIRFDSNRILNIGAVYRSPTSTADNDQNLLNLINKLSKSNGEELLIIGDFNYRNINWNTNTLGMNNTASEENFLNCIRSNLLTQHITSPTRARGSDTPSLLDLVISNYNFIENIHNLSPIGKSDHSVLHIVCDFNFEYIPRPRLNFNKGDYDGLRTFISNRLNQEDSRLIYLGNDVENQWQFLKKSIDTGVQNFIPVTVNAWANNNRQEKSPLPPETN